MQLKKLLKVGVVSAITTTALLGSCFSNETHAALVDQPISDTQVKYFNASFYDVNPEGYNAYHRKITPEEYYSRDLQGKANADQNSLLFGSTEGRCLGGYQNNYLAPEVYSQSNGVTQGLVKSKLKNGLVEVKDGFNNGTDLFNMKGLSYAGRPCADECLENWKFPFLKEADGYYTFNSNEYHVSRDYQNKTFKLHKGGRDGFYPFNNCSDNTFNTSERNMFFTAKIEIPFYMTTDGKIKNSQTGNFDDMIFNFQGDDDVWVFVDDNLYVDLGGAHTNCHGNINFAKSTVYYSQIKNWNNDTDSYNITKSVSKVSPGYHTLRVFYMERAGGTSNLFVRFNLQSAGLKEKHVEQYTNKLLDSRIYSGAIDQTITTAPKTFDNHKLVQEPANRNVVLKEGLQEVTYVYAINHNLKVSYVDLYDRTKIAPDKNTKLYEGDSYNEKPIDIKDYTFIKAEGTTSGKMPNGDASITFYYAYNQCKANVNYIDKVTGEKLATDQKIGKEQDKVSFEEKTIEGYKLVEKPTSNDVTLTKKEQTINYYYKKIGNIKVNHIDQVSREVLDMDNFSGLEEDKIKTQSKKFNNYILFKAPETEDYTIGREEQTVNYYYIFQANVIVNYIDRTTYENLDSYSQILNEGDVFSAEEKSFENYKLVEKPAKDEITVGKEDIVLNYYYEPLKFNLKLEMNFVEGSINEHYYHLHDKLSKAEIVGKEAKDFNSKVRIKQRIKVTNDNERKGSGTISIKVPAQYEALAEDNPGWDITDGKITRKTGELEPGQSVEYDLVLRKNNYGNICEHVITEAEIVSDGIEEVTLEDNKDKTELVIYPKTGEEKILYISGIIVLLLSVLGRISIKKIGKIKQNKSR